MDKEVAWMNDAGSCFLSDGNKYSGNWIPLYTSPPKREPLSDAAIAELWANKSPMNEFECTKLIEQAHGIGVDDE